MWTMLKILAALSCFYVASGVNNGQLVNIRDFPYVVAIVKHDVTKTGLCTGGIIGDRFILSAAHCFTKKKRLAFFSKYKRKYVERIVKVYLGVNNVRQLRNAWYAVAEEIYMIKGYLENRVADIAILKLDRNISEAGIPFEKLTIANQDNNVESAAERGIFVTAGYGDDPSNDARDRRTEGSLRKVYTLSLRRDKCKGRKEIIIEGTKQLCCLSRDDPLNIMKTPQHPLGTCQGDSGAPIVTQNEPHIVKGVVGRVPPLCDGRVSPELHTNIAAFADTFIYPVLYGRSRAYKDIVKYPSRSESCPA